MKTQARSLFTVGGRQSAILLWMIALLSQPLSFTAKADFLGREGEPTTQNCIVVSAKEISEPVAARYNWVNAPTGWLFNSQNLPAAPFRSDQW
ncbi:MAG: hypothetical protein NTZ16_04315 [Verrucomicrobia bacterium]|nr:hypothetical protein [Verrucomicrobiota bacterium]